MALRLRDPHEHGSWGFCPSKALTGWDCPGCGGLRAVNDLTHGEVVQAWHSNALFVSLIPVVVLVWIGWVVFAATGRRPAVAVSLGRLALVVLPVVAIAFAVVRNTPWGRTFYAD